MISMVETALQGVGVAELRMALDQVAFARKVGLVPDRWQESFLRSEHPRKILNCSRQSGKTTMAGLVALHQVVYHPGSLVLCLSPSLRQSSELFRKALEFYRALDRPVPPESETKLSLYLENGSRLISLPGTEAKIRGYSNVSLLIADEASRIEDELYYSVRPMLAVSGGSLIMMSTPWGRRGVFYETRERGEGWERYTVPASNVPRISKVFLEEERRALGPWFFEQEYFCKFLDTIDQVFRTEDIEAALDSNVKPLFGGTAA